VKFIQGIFILTFFLQPVLAQTTDTIQPFDCKKKQILSTSMAVSVYGGGTTLLYQLWYKDFSRSGFHFHNDNNEWLQMDKAGHVYSAYHIGELGYQAAKYSCMGEKASIWGGGGLGLLFLTTIEVFDGFSDGWGASAGDMIANTTGYLMFAGQQSTWNEQRFRLKFSYFPGKYAQYRPDQLGNSEITSVFKDYNAQSYWLSFSPSVFSKKAHTYWPQWLCLSLGYSADGMLGGTSNPAQYNGTTLPVFERQRQYYLSLDIDFSKIKVRHKATRILLHGLNAIKIPFPALSYSTFSGAKFHWLYF